MSERKLSETQTAEAVKLSDLLAAIKRYNKINKKSLYLVLYQDGSGYFGEEIGLYDEVEFEFDNINELLIKLGS